MLISIRTRLEYTANSPCDVLLQIEAAQDESQVCESVEISLPHAVSDQIISGEEQVGIRRWVRSAPTFDCSYEAKVRVTRDVVDLDTLTAHPLTQLSADTTRFLMPSRYCHPEAFLDLVSDKFGSLSGGALISAMSRWINATFTYDNGISTSATTATESLAARSGVCRDYAHVLIAMARGAGIPARFASVYAPTVVPQDFHALAEVFLGGRWHIVDPTGMADPAQVVKIGVGRDAAEVSFMTSYGWMTLKNQTVDVKVSA